MFPRLHKIMVWSNKKIKYELIFSICLPNKNKNKFMDICISYWIYFRVSLVKDLRGNFEQFFKFCDD